MRTERPREKRTETSLIMLVSIASALQLPHIVAARNVLFASWSLTRCGYPATLGPRIAGSEGTRSPLGSVLLFNAYVRAFLLTISGNLSPALQASVADSRSATIAASNDCDTKN